MNNTNTLNKIYKGVSKRKNSARFESYVMIKNAGGFSKRNFKAHVGTFDTAKEAYSARISFIDNLK